MILVVGPGRCGTSTVARFLQKNGINMGNKFIPADKNNPEGYFEDIKFRDLNNAILWDKISLPQWRKATAAIIKQRQEPWGLKDPKIANLIDEYNRLLPSAYFIRCHRDFDEICKSIERVYGHQPAKVKQMVIWREQLLNKGLIDAPVLEIDVTNGSEWKPQVKELIQSAYPNRIQESKENPCQT